MKANNILKRKKTGAVLFSSIFFTVSCDGSGGNNSKYDEAYFLENLTFTLNEEGNGYEVNGGGKVQDCEHIIIPAEYESLPVIGVSGFAHIQKLKTIDIPDSVLYYSS